MLSQHLFRQWLGAVRHVKICVWKYRLRIGSHFVPEGGEKLTYLPLGVVAKILKVQYSNSGYGLNNWALRHQVITWTNVDLSSVRFIGTHLRAILGETPQPWIYKISLKIIYLRPSGNYIFWKMNMWNKNILIKNISRNGNVISPWMFS